MIGDIFEVVWVGLLTGVGITTAYSLVVLGSGNYATARRSNRGGAAFGWALVAGVALLVCVGGLAYGVHILLST